VHYVGRRYDEAIVAGKRATGPTYGFGFHRLGMAYSEKGRHEEAIAALETAVKLSGDTTQKPPLGRAYAFADRPSEARRILEELLDLSRRGYMGPTQIATIYVALGENDEALRWLEEGYRVRDGNMVLLKVWPAYDPLRGEPRFRDLLERMKFP
jgi:tetratricopeptide (TPR) repeat protein